MPIRVVAGEAKGRRLKTPKTTSTRPIIDRVKTALFDILSVRVEDVRFLDLFAGTGSVGIEALSRGAASATFIELNPAILKLVRENLQITGLADRAETVHADAFKFLQAHFSDNNHVTKLPTKAERSEGVGYLSPRQGTLPGGQVSRFIAPGEAGRSNSPNENTQFPNNIQYDIIYIAPPQYKGMAARALALLDNSSLVPDTGLVIVQIHPKERTEVAAVPLSRLALTDERRYGSTLLMFYEVSNKEKLTHVDTTTEG